jgi:hypothetical protein
MKYLILILLLSSCYTKQNAINKFCKNDTIQTTITVHDTIIIDSIQVDTVFSDTIDSVFITKDRIEIRYIKKFGKIYIEGKCKGDTIYYEKKVIVEVPINCPKLSWLNQMAIDSLWWLIVIIAILIILV